MKAGVCVCVGGGGGGSVWVCVCVCVLRESEPTQKHMEAGSSIKIISVSTAHQGCGGDLATHSRYDRYVHCAIGEDHAHLSLQSISSSGCLPRKVRPCRGEPVTAQFTRGCDWLNGAAKCQTDVLVGCLLSTLSAPFC